MSRIDHRNYQPHPQLLDGRVILVTGAGSGIGAAAAQAFAAHGATLILLGRTTRNLESVHDAIVAAGHPRPSIAVMDLAKAQGPAYFDLVAQLRATYGRLDGLLHNAAMLGDRTPIEQYDVGTWHQVLHLNLTAPFVLTQQLMPLLRESADASVVFTSSGVGRHGRAYWGAYAVSKFGIEGLAQVLADETRDVTRIRVNCINPGGTRTAMRRHAYPAELPDARPEPARIMGPYLYLMGPDSVGCTGQSLDCQ
ncbi:putative oxidoreductase YciK [Gammaproteobacteria bacterium]|nr:YciK family oxidoreductase [Gammaproteobacteria bacterium]QOJ31476.1 MAG: YciK family oxidoreductase [Gammaproteobacteria bacterium]CAG0943158.1 putative oxidoreductase YciK [Gammaproteobacteria bacterium]